MTGFNPYRDQAGRFSSPGKEQEGRRVLIQTLLHEGNSAEAFEHYQEYVALHGEPDFTAVDMRAVAEAASYEEADLARMSDLLENGNAAELEEFITERTSREAFTTLLEQRDNARASAKLLVAEHESLKEAWKNGTLNSYEPVREKGFEALEAYENLQVLKNQTNQYKDLHALAVARYGELLRSEAEEAGTWREYDADTLNDLQATGDFPSGSREWLEQRQQGIGGSDVGKITGADAEYRARNLEQVWASKVDPISEEEVARQAEGHTSYAGATGRGNAWEDVILNKFAQNNPEANVTFCKTSWAHKDRPYQFANFDGLMTDENGVPNGIVEIKTASDASKWGPTDAGLDGVPSGYRAQALWYADAAGFDKGAVAVMIDDKEYREYHFTVTPELRKEMESNRAAVEKFVAKVDEAKKNGISGKLNSSVTSKGFSENMLSRIRNGHYSYLKEASIYRDESLETTTARFQQLLPNLPEGEKVTNTHITAALLSLYGEKNPADMKSPLISIDLETTAMRPTQGRILEVGLSIRNPAGGEAEKFQKLYGIPKKAMAGIGTGPVDVHKITNTMVAKKRNFLHPEEQKSLLKKLTSGILVAHNAQFELSWLRQHLKGFAEAERAGKIRVLDTMSLSRRFVPETKDNRLESFAGNFGIDYVNAHRAYSDAAMTGLAVERMRQKVYETFGRPQQRQAA